MRKLKIINWNKKKTVVLFVSILVTMAMQSMDSQIVKDASAQSQQSDKALAPQLESSSTISQANKKLSINGVTNAELAKRLNVTEVAINKFFAILGQQKIHADELEQTMQKLAERHKELEKRSGLMRSEHPEIMIILQQARKALNKARYEEAETLYEQAASLDNAVAEKSTEHYSRHKRSAAENMALKAELLHTRFAFIDATRAYERAINLSEEGKAEEKTAEYQNMLGRIYHDNGKYDQAIVLYEKALAGNLRIHGEDHQSVAKDRNHLGLAWQDLGQYAKAIEYLELALASNLKTYGEDHPSVMIDRNDLGVAWQAQKQYEKAIHYYEQALASGLKIYGEDHPHVAIYRNNLGEAWGSLGNHKKAIGYYEQALASDLRTFGNDHLDVAIDRNNLGLAWQSLGQYEKAIEYLTQALASFKKHLGADHPDTLVVGVNLESVKQMLPPK